MSGLENLWRGQLEDNPRRSLGLWLFVVFLSRALMLLLGGGTTFWPDEIRYTAYPWATMDRLIHGDGRLHDILPMLLQGADHLGFKAVFLGPALVQALTRANFVTPALFNCLLSTGVVGLIYLIARELSASRFDAWLTSFACALFVTLAYYSRHLLPYDLALFCGMASITVTLRLCRGGGSASGLAFVSGFLGCLCFLSYNGYWVLAAFCGLLAAWSFLRSDRRKLLAFSLGFFLPFILFWMADHHWAWSHYYASLKSFSGTITQGVFEEGWKLPWMYFWESEHFLFVIGLGALILVPAIGGLRDAYVRRAFWGALVYIIFMYALFVLGSNVARKFVVYGRLARQMTPAIGALVGLLLVEAFRKSRTVGGVVFAVFLAQAAFNWAPVYALRSPDWVRHWLKTRYPGASIKFETTPEVWEPLKAEALAGPPDLFVYNNQHLFGFTRKFHPDPACAVLVARFPHPFSFTPYLYEGYLPPDREFLRSIDHSIRILRATSRCAKDAPTL